MHPSKARRYIQTQEENTMMNIKRFEKLTASKYTWTLQNDPRNVKTQINKPTERAGGAEHFCLTCKP